MTRIGLIVLVLVSASVAQAHKPSDSYLSLRQAGATLEGQWDIALRDLDYAIGLDADEDGAITWGEVRARHEVIATHALAHLHVQADGAPCRSHPTDQLIDHHTDGAYAVLRFVVECPAPPALLDLGYRLLFDLDPQHRGLLSLATTDGTQTALFSVDHPTQHIAVARPSAWRTVAEFWRDGVWHIWLGYDHVLFLLSLLMPAVLRRAGGRWRGVPSFGAALSETLKIVTAFTVAHSITLTLAAFGVVHLPSRLVESGIAASIVVAALNNAYPHFDGGRWILGFAFGLLHGFGFASVLADPGLPTGQLALALFGFNAGVETGQLVIVAGFLPLAFVVRRSWMYQRLTLVAGSVAIALLASAWMIERLFNLKVLPI